MFVVESTKKAIESFENWVDAIDGSDEASLVTLDTTLVNTNNMDTAVIELKQSGDDSPKQQRKNHSDRTQRQSVPYNTKLLEEASLKMTAIMEKLRTDLEQARVENASLIDDLEMAGAASDYHYSR
jgi:hypothetical protein